MRFMMRLLAKHCQTLQEETALQLMLKEMIKCF
jgi:hypothetical protein